MRSVTTARQIGLVVEPSPNFRDVRTNFQDIRDSVEILAKQRRGLPLMLSGRPRIRVPRLVALYGDEFNLRSVTLREFAAGRARVSAACEALGRDPRTLRMSVTLDACTGVTASEFQSRALRSGLSLEQLHQRGIAGVSEAVKSAIDQWKRVGVDVLYLRLNDLFDLDHAVSWASRVIPSSSSG